MTLRVSTYHHRPAGMSEPRSPPAQSNAAAFCECCLSDELYGYTAAPLHSVCRNCQSIRYRGPELDYPSYYGLSYYNGDLFGTTRGRVGYDRSYWERGGGPSCLKNIDILRRFRLFYGLNRGSISSWLDVGCGLGHFLHQVRDHFDIANLVGTELNPAVIERARALYDLKIEPSPKGTFEVISMMNSLEHVGGDINPFLASMTQHATQSTKLIIFIPNASSANFWLYGATWNLFLPGEHVRYITVLGLRDLMLRHGWAIQHSWTYGQPLHNSRAASERFVDRLLKPVFSIRAISRMTNEHFKIGPMLIAFCGRKGN